VRLMHLNDHIDYVGGVETYVLSTIPLLEQRGIAQAVVYGKGEPGRVERGFHVPQISNPSPADSRLAADGVTRAIEEFQPDLAQVHNLQNVAAIEACLQRIPTVLYVPEYRYVCPASSFYFRRTNTICERTCSPACFALGPVRRCLTPRIPLNLWYYRRVQWMKRHAHRFASIIAISGYVRDRLIAGGFPADKINVLPYYCPLSPVDAPAAAPEEHSILFLGRMTRYKGTEQFIRILAKLPSNVRGVMVGNADAPLRRSIVSLATQLGCENRLEIRSWASREEIREIIARTSVVTFPSVYPEALGLVGMEAMATGVPVVGFDVGGTSEWLHNGRTGYSVAVNDLDGFASRIQEILQSPELRQTLATNGLQVIEEKFSQAHHLSELEKLYRRVTSGNAAAADLCGETR
jgi:glycosyltransferase involved in cell wall biosynthesis